MKCHLNNYVGMDFHNYIALLMHLSSATIWKSACPRNIQIHCLNQRFIVTQKRLSSGQKRFIG
jgi:hypothetical protein